MTTFTSPQDGTSQDNWMAHNAPTTTYYNDVTLHIGEDNSSGSIRRSLIRIPGLNSGAIDSRSIVDAASLFLKLSGNYANNAGTLYVYRSSRAWTDNACWNNYHTGTAWATAGGMGAGDYDNNLVGSISLAAAEAAGWKEIVLSTALIQAIVQGTYAQPSFILKMSGESDDLHLFRSADYTTSTDRPYIVVTHHLPAGYPKIIIP